MKKEPVIRTKNFAVVMTKGQSLETWYTLGIIDRETAVYRLIAERTDINIVLITYGKEDYKVCKKMDLPFNQILSPPHFLNSRWGHWVYSLTFSLIHFSSLKNIEIYRSNQINGSWGCILAKYLTKSIFWCRSGYLLTQFVSDRRIFKRFIYVVLEWIVMKLADVVEVSSEKDKELVARKYNIREESIILNRNFVGTFLNPVDRPLSKKHQIVLAGRIEYQKNIGNTIEGIRKANSKIKIVVVGDGSLREFYEIKYENDENIIFLGIISQRELWRIFGESEYYVLCSHFEGMPKTLLEALIMGCLCLGTNVSGISEVIVDGETGVLSTNPSSDEISIAATRLFSLDSSNRERILENALTYISQKHSLENYTETILNKIVSVTR